MEIKNLIEALLFISGKPVSVNRLSDILKKDKKEIIDSADQLINDYNTDGKGVHILKAGNSYQMATSPQATYIIKDFIRSEQSGELTKPSLETLTIIAYRGPITKAELEQIRGINCGLIIRNLLIKGLVEAKEDSGKMATVYNITFDFLKFLGLDRAEDLPDFTKLNSDENLKKLFEKKVANKENQEEQNNS